MEDLFKCEGFDWDEYNAQKNWIKHGINTSECEQVFFNWPFRTAEDAEHSGSEKRYYALGKTDEGKLIFIIYTIRHNFIRVISARPMSRKERKRYKKHEKENT